MRIVTANVNGIRAAVRRGGLEWLAAQDADVVCLQEVRATDDQLAEALAGTAFEGWTVAHSPSVQLGRSGVAVLSRAGVLAQRTGVGVPDLDEQGRWLEVDVESPDGPLTVVSVYVHTGEADTPKQVEKYRFLDAVTDRLAALSKAETDGTGAGAVVCGDLNVAHREVDIKNWKGNRGKAGFLEAEREYLDDWFDRLGWVDLGRRHGGDGPGPYTWWSWRGKAFDNDAGWRIDYQLASPLLAPRAAGVSVGRAAAYAERWSDHAAVTVDYTF